MMGELGSTADVPGYMIQECHLFPCSVLAYSGEGNTEFTSICTLYLKPRADSTLHNTAV